MIHKNLSSHKLIEESLKREEGHLSKDGVLVVNTGSYTGRSPAAKFIVKDDLTKDTVDWGEVNKSISSDEFGIKFIEFENFILYDYSADLFEQEVFAGADKDFRLSVRVITEFAWHSVFVNNMFIKPTKGELEEFVPEYTIICLPSIQYEPMIWMDLTRKIVLISGTEYAGEIKKSVFTLMNYLLPEQNVMPMHCSVNVGLSSGSAIFFGLSGTGKTTLSADTDRWLVGDDEHGWGENGLFNFEGGCYAKVINLTAEAEPEIYDTCHMFGTVLENVVMNDGIIDLGDSSLTQNTRASYPLHFIPNIVESGTTTHPENIFMLTCDAFGVLPPLSKLNARQAVYYFLSGYTAKVAGTESGLGNEPRATFSTCFGAPFMPRAATVYADLLRKKIEGHNVQCWLVNTGWIGGGYGVGERISIQYTRALIKAVLHSKFQGNGMFMIDSYGLGIPVTCKDVPAEILYPRGYWDDTKAFDQASDKLRDQFRKNFKQYEDFTGKGRFIL